MQLSFLRMPTGFIASAIVLVGLSSVCLADTITVTPSSASPDALAPSSDTISLHGGPVTINPGGSPTLFQTGDFVLGDSEIPDQSISFTLQDTVTFNGVTQVLDISGVDNVTDAADTLTIAGGMPIDFGGASLTIQPFSASGYSIGQDIPIDLYASVAETPEPGSLLLLGTGLIAGVAFWAGKRSRVQALDASAKAAVPQRAFAGEATPSRMSESSETVSAVGPAGWLTPPPGRSAAATVA